MDFKCPSDWAEDISQNHSVGVIVLPTPQKKKKKKTNLEKLKDTVFSNPQVYKTTPCLHALTRIKQLPRQSPNESNPPCLKLSGS